VPLIDFRVQPSLFRHPKFLRLVNELGAEAGISLFRLWAYAAENRPMGKFDGLQADDLELAAGWTGEPSRFVKTLLNVRFLDEGRKSLILHDWADHQGWLVHAPQRSAHARTAARRRWEELEFVRATPTSKEHCPQLFQRFWHVYPRKTAKPRAQKAWNKLKPDDALAEKLIADVGPRWAGYEKGAIPHPATYLNEGRWEDEIVPPLTNGRRAAAPTTPLVDAGDYLRQTEKATR
jgi:hypothetical protein